MSSATANGVTAVTVAASISSPTLSASAESDGATVATVTALLNGVHYTSAVSHGRTAVQVSPTGNLVVSVESDGLTAVSIGVAVQWRVSLRADGVTNAMVIFSPDLFGDGDYGAYDPNAIVPISMAPPIKLGMDLRGACSVIPPPPVLP